LDFIEYDWASLLQSHSDVKFLRYLSHIVSWCPSRPKSEIIAAPATQEKATKDLTLVAIAFIQS